MENVDVQNIIYKKGINVFMIVIPLHYTKILLN